MERNTYDTAFFDALRHGTIESAAQVVPILVADLQPDSVVDVGCGEGIWLSAFSDMGVDDVVGIDGDWVDPRRLAIPKERFVESNLEQPFSLDRRFGLALSLEVAEHLPPSSAEGFVASLANLASLIVFSAAIPLQGGTNHQNERWPEYWAELFSRHAFLPIDWIRPKIWRDHRVEWWYKQNMILYADRDALDRHPILSAAAHPPWPLAIVHPDAFLEAAGAEDSGIPPYCRR
jgi:hypothetical protein